MRLDKFLQVSRLVKRRTVANMLCSRGQIFVNGQVAKAAKTLSVGDVLRMPQKSGGAGATDSRGLHDEKDFREVRTASNAVCHVSYEVVEIPSGNVSRARATTLYRQLLE